MVIAFIQKPNGSRCVLLWSRIDFSPSLSPLAGGQSVLLHVLCELLKLSRTSECSVF